MILFLRIFILISLLYHVLVTGLGFGVFHGNYPQLPALLRDGIRILFFGIAIISHIRSVKSYRKQWNSIWISFFWLLLFSLGISWLKDKSTYDMFIGFKYGFQYILIFLTAGFLGYAAGYKKSLNEQKKDIGLQALFKRIIWIFIGCAAIGLLWQRAKLFWPNFFFSFGYGPLNDFYFGTKPPIYYLTGFGGTLRLQGIFSGPNNYGYFLVIFLPLLLAYFSSRFSSRKVFFADKKNIIFISVLILWIGSIFLTLSRTALIGMIIVLALRNSDRWKKHRKRTAALGIFILGAIGGLSILKGSSTLAHIAAKFNSLSYVLQHPLGYGLGTSGPAIHHNGTLLPENYFIQLLLDIGVLGFAFWIVVVWYIGQILKRIQKIIYTKHPEFFSYNKAFIIGGIAFLGMGMFLHVFEDSMVNYSFFGIWGFFLGYISNKYLD